MTKSMTGFASATGAGHGYTWGWEIRAVNARGMDARLRLPDGLDGLENELRTAIKKTVTRGNINLTLRLAKEGAEQPVTVDLEILRNLLTAIKQIETTAQTEHNLTLAPTSAADILAIPSIKHSSADQQDTGEITKALTSDFNGLLAAFDDMRIVEGAALKLVLTGQLDRIAALTKDADGIARSRSEQTAENLRHNLARVLENADSADPDRVAQELAILTLKSDVTEEIDRLNAHVSAARDLLKYSTPAGRKLDFLAQEFNREVNTLCSKAQANDLTRVGLELKAVIEQFREQIQNVE